jgi:hypothetical protein
VLWYVPKGHFGPEEVLLSRQQNLQALATSGQARVIPTTLSLAERYAVVIAALEKRGSEVFRNPRNVEYTPRWLYRFRSVKGTSLEPIVTALNDAGMKVRPTMQGVMDALELNPYALHNVACYCHCPESMGTGIVKQLLQKQKERVFL